MEQIEKKPETFPDRIFQRMTEEERMHMLCLSICGLTSIEPDGTYVVMMGMDGLNRITDYENEMIWKYAKAGEFYPIRKKYIPAWKTGSLSVL